jgi:hypothetical protein
VKQLSPFLHGECVVVDWNCTVDACPVVVGHLDGPSNLCIGCCHCKCCFCCFCEWSSVKLQLGVI